MSPSGKIKKSEPPLHFPFMQEENRLSMAMENYLLSILRLEEQEIKVTVVGLSEHFKNLPKAEGLGTSLPSVSAMVRRLAREQLVQTGLQVKKFSLQNWVFSSAQSILRRHRLAARLAVDVLGVELKYAYREAHRLEHAISPYLEHRIIELLQSSYYLPLWPSYSRLRIQKTEEINLVIKC
ncbi:MAG: metal-dependent transcriptional regulator [Dehalococcoidia bacterium]